MIINDIVTKELLEIINKEIDEVINYKKIISKRKRINTIKDLSLNETIEKYSNIDDRFEKEKEHLIKTVNDNIVSMKNLLNIMKFNKDLSKLSESIFLLDNIVRLEDSSNKTNKIEPKFNVSKLKMKAETNSDTTIYHFIYTNAKEYIKKVKNNLN